MPRRRANLAIVVAMAPLAACGGTPSPPASAPVGGDLEGPWQAVPSRVAFDVAQPYLDACNAQIRRDARMPPIDAADVVVIDARGERRLYLVTRLGGECFATRQPDGSLQVSSAGSLGPTGGALTRAAHDAIVVSNGSVTDANGPVPISFSTVVGEVDGDVAAVVIRASGLEFRASVGGGRFAAWWPRAGAVDSVQPFGSDGRPLLPAHP